MNQGVIASVKRRYRAGLLRMLVDEDDLVAFWKKLTILDAIHGISDAWQEVKPHTLVRSWRKILPDIEESDFQAFSDEEITTAQIMNLATGLNGFEDVDEENLNEWLKIDACEPGFQYMSDAEIVTAASQQNKEEDSECESVDEDSDLVSHCTALQCVDTLLDYRGQREFQYNNIIASRKIRNTVRKNVNSSQKQTNITDYFKK